MTPVVPDALVLLAHERRDTHELEPSSNLEPALAATDDEHLGVTVDEVTRVATLVNPLASFIFVTLRILRTILLVILSHLPGSRQKIKKISVANTNVVYHDGRAMALCESGPPMRIQLPGLETV